MPAGPGTVAPATNVALDVKPTDWGLQDPLDQATKALNLKSGAQAMQQRAQASQLAGAEGAQRLQAGALGIQQTQQDLKDQQILGDVYRSMGAPAPGQPPSVPGGSPAPPAGGVPQGPQGTNAIDPSAILMRALQDPRGFSGKGASALLSSAMEFRAKNAAIQKDQADTASKQAETNQKRNEAVFGATGGLLQMDPVDRAAAFPAVRQRVIDEGHVDPSQIPEDYAQWGGDAQLMKTHLAFGTQASIDAENKSKADLIASKADEARKAAQGVPLLKKAQNEAVTSAPNEQGLTPQAASEAQNRADVLAQKRANDSAELKVKQGELGVSQGRLGLEQKTFNQTWGMGDAARVDTNGAPLHGEEFLAKLPPGRAAQVKAFANGSIDESDLPRGAGKQPFLDAVMQYDPAFTKQAAQTRKDFGSAGKSGQNIQSLNTATVHLDQLGQAADAMNNGTFKPGNAVVNGLRTTFGGAAPTNFEGLKSAVASEMASALKGNATDQEIAAAAKTISDSSSPAQLKGIIETNMHVLGAKLNTKDEQYHAAVPGDTAYSPVLPTAAAVYAKHGIQPIQRLAGQATVNLRAPDGTIKAVPAADAEHYISKGAKRVP